MTIQQQRMVSFTITLTNQFNDNILDIPIDTGHTLWFKSQPVCTANGLHIGMNYLISMGGSLDRIDFTFQKINGQHFIHITSAHPWSHIV